MTVNGITVAGTDAGNYNLGSTSAATTADITPRALNIAASKSEDGSNRFESTQMTLGNVVQGDQVALSGNADVASANVGQYSAFAANHLQSSSSNYSVTGGAVDARIVAKVAQEPEAIRLARITEQSQDQPAPNLNPNILNLRIEGDGARAPVTAQLQQLP